MAKHHVLSPSSYDRWSPCPGSLIGPPPERDENDAAREGTACHALCEFCLKTGIAPSAMKGVVINGDNKFPVSDEMVEGAELYLNTVRSACLELGIPLTKLMSEQYLTSSYVPNELFGGTTDAYAIHDGVLLVVDLKFGRKPVKATSGQLTCYALLAMGMLPKNDRPIHRIVQILVQPRSKDGEVLTRHEPSQKEIEIVWGRVMNAAQVYLQYGNLDRSPDKYLKSGSHCEYCPRKRNCPAFLKDMSDAFLLATSEVKPITTNDEVAALLYWLDRKDSIEKFLKECHVRLLEAAQQGVPIPGKKLVATWGHRKWWTEDPNQVIAALSHYGIDPRLVTETSVISPAQVEKVVKEHCQSAEERRRVTRDINDRLVRRPPTGSTLKPVEAKGDPITPGLIAELMRIEKEREE